jgi:hypothetical protein
MILSYSNRILFIKSRKTGGTSVEIALSRMCDDRDIITLITPIDEYIRLHEGRCCQNCLCDSTLEKEYIQLLKSSNPKLRKIPPLVKSGQKFYNHMSISEVAALVPFNLDGFFKFTIERHPYDKAVSFANFHLKYRSYIDGGEMRVELDHIAPAIDQLIESGKLQQKIRNYNLYTHQGRIAVDKIIRYEQLNEELALIFRSRGLPDDASLRHVKAGVRDRTIPAKDILTRSQKDWINRVCAEEFVLMDYSAD